MSCCIFSGAFGDAKFYRRARPSAPRVSAPRVSDNLAGRASLAKTVFDAVPRCGFDDVGALFSRRPVCLGDHQSNKQDWVNMKTVSSQRASRTEFQN